MAAAVEFLRFAGSKVMMDLVAFETFIGHLSLNFELFFAFSFIFREKTDGILVERRPRLAMENEVNEVNSLIESPEEVQLLCSVNDFLKM
jgi:hypothetical protein